MNGSSTLKVVTGVWGLNMWNLLILIILFSINTISDLTDLMGCSYGSEKEIRRLGSVSYILSLSGWT